MAEILGPHMLDHLTVEIDKGRYVPRDLLRDLVYTARVYHAERRMLAKLAADTPQFSNPLTVVEVQNLRDRILGERSLTPSEETKPNAK